MWWALRFVQGGMRICAHIEVVVKFSVLVHPLWILAPRTNFDDLWCKFSYRRAAASVCLPACKSVSRVFFKAFKLFKNLNDLDFGDVQFPASSDDDFSRRIRICDRKCWILASRGLNIWKFDLENFEKHVFYWFLIKVQGFLMIPGYEPVELDLEKLFLLSV